MSDGHADKLKQPPRHGGTPDRAEQIVDPALLARDDLRAALARHDISTVYQALKDAGISQRRIAQRTGQTQSEVFEILSGRRVRAYDVLVRIAEGLHIPRHYMGLSYGASSSHDGYRGVVTVTTPEADLLDMLRRHLLALGATAAFGAPIKTLGGLADRIPVPDPVPQPSRLSPVHVAQVRDVTRRLREALLDHGSNLDISSAAAAWADQLLGIPGPETLMRDLMSAVAELHILAAGWAGLDAGCYGHALYHYSRGLDLATETGNAYLQAIALACSGLTLLEQDHPDDALKMLQFAQVKSWDIQPEHDRRMVESCAQSDSVIALIEIGETCAAGTELAKSRQLWRPTRADPRGDQDYITARLEISQGRLDTAEPFAVASVARWEGISELRRAHSAAVLATIHVQAGEPDGLRLAHSAITAVTRLSSVSARKRLEPLADALDTRPGSDARNLARMARQVATTRA